MLDKARPTALKPHTGLFQKGDRFYQNRDRFFQRCRAGYCPPADTLLNAATIYSPIRLSACGAPAGDRTGAVS